MTAPEDPNGLREALARAEAERDHEKGLGCTWRKAAEDWARERDEILERSLVLFDRALAAEAEITRLKEGMEARERENDRLVEMVEKLVLNATTGGVPRAIIVAAGDLLATLSPKEQP